MKHGLKFCVAALAFALICMGGLIPHTFSAKAEIVDSGECGAFGDNLTWTLDDQGVLTISGSGYMDDFIASDAPPLIEGESWGSPAPWGTGITRAILENGVGNIGSCAFYDCGALTSVTIPDSVTSIGVQAFAGCGGLASVTIPNSVTNIYSYAFAGCEGLTSVTIPTGTEFMDYGAFCYCTNLSGVTILNPDAVIGDENLDVFEECAAGLTLHGWPGSTAQTYADSAGLAFAPLAACGANGDNLAWVLDDQGVLTISGTGEMEGYFSSSPAPWGTGITRAVIENGVTSIGGFAFYECGSLESIAIPDSVNSIGEYAFYNCSALTDVTIPDGVTGIGNRTFSGCSALASVTIPNNVTSIGDWAFYECGSLENVVLPYGVTSIAYKVFYGCANLTSIAIPYGVTSIDQYAFYECSSLESIAIPDSVTSIGVDAIPTSTTIYTSCAASPTAVAQYAENNGIPYELIHDFDDGVCSRCGAMEGIVASGTCGDNLAWTLDDQGVLTISGTGEMDTFYYSSSWGTDIEQVIIENGATSISSYAFYGCGSLTSVTIPESVTSIGEGAFTYCEQLTEFVVSNTNPSFTALDGVLYDKSMTAIICYPAGKAGTTFAIPDGVISIGLYAFNSCGSLTSVVLPNSVESIGDCAFWECSNLANMTIPDSVTSIGWCAFWGCSNLASVTIPNSVTSIGEWAFMECSSLTSVTIPNSVTSIGVQAFAGCSSLVSLTIQESVTSIGTEAFAGCTSLTSVTIPASVESIGNYAFGGCASLSSVTILNPGAEIGDDDYDVFEDCAEGLTLYGWAGSTTELYADNAGLAFLPVAADFVLPAGLTTIEADAFQGIGAVAVRIPSGVTSIDGNPFADSGVQYIFGAPGTAAETFAANYGYTFVPVNDLVTE